MSRVQTRGGQAVDRVVGARDRLVDVVELDRREHRAEDLLARDRHLGRDVVEDRRLHEVALAGADVGALAAGDERRAFLLRRSRCSAARVSICSFETIAPSRVFGSSGSPGAIFFARAATLSMNSSLIDSSTSSREPAAQTSPLP